MKNLIVIFACAAGLAYCLPAFGQCLSREAVIAFNKGEENTRHFLGVITYKDSEFTDLVFIKKKGEAKAVYETIRVDEDLYTVEKFEEDDKDFAKDVFHGLAYKEVSLSVNSVTSWTLITSNFTWTEVKKHERTYVWNWDSGSYTLSEEVQKEGLKGNSIFSPPGTNNLFVLVGHHFDSDRQELILVGKSVDKQEFKSPVNKAGTYYIVRYNINLEIISTQTFEIEYSHGVVFSDVYQLEDDKLVLVLAPQLPHKKHKYHNPAPFRYKLLIINSNGELERQIDFHNPCFNWKIHGLEFVEDEIIIYGAGEKLNGSTGSGEIPVSVSTSKEFQGEWRRTLYTQPNDYIQLCRIQADGSSYKNVLIPTEDIKAVAKPLDSHKVGGQILSGHSIFLSAQKGQNGQIFLTGTVRDPLVEPGGYTDYFFLRIDSTDKLTHLYSMSNPEYTSMPVFNLNTRKFRAQVYPGQSYVYEAPNNPDSLLWVHRNVHKVKYETNGFSFLSAKKAIVLYKPFMFEIDLRTSGFSACQDRLDKDFFLYGNFLGSNGSPVPHVVLEKPGEWLLLGKNKQDNIWLGKLAR